MALITLYTKADIQHEFHVTKHHLNQLIKNKQFPPPEYQGGRMLYWKKDTVYQYKDILNPPKPIPSDTHHIHQWMHDIKKRTENEITHSTDVFSRITQHWRSQTTNH